MFKLHDEQLNNKDILKCLILIDKFDVKHISSLFFKSSKTIYRWKQEITNEIKSHDHHLDSSIVQKYINFALTILYENPNICMTLDRKSVVISIIKILKNKFKYQIDFNTIKEFNYFIVKDNMMSFYLLNVNTFEEISLNDNFEAFVFSGILVEQLNKLHNFVFKEELLAELTNYTSYNWLVFKYNICYPKEISFEFPTSFNALLVLLSNTFNDHNLFLNKYELFYLANFIIKFCLKKAYKVNILSNNIHTQKLIQKQLIQKFTNITFVSYNNQYDLQIIPKLSKDDKILVTSIYLDEEDISNISKLIY